MEDKNFKKVELDKEIAKAKALLEEYDNSNEGQSNLPEDLFKMFSNKGKDSMNKEQFKEKIDSLMNNERINLMLD